MKTFVVFCVVFDFNGSVEEVGQELDKLIADHECSNNSYVEFYPTSDNNYNPDYPALGKYIKEKTGSDNPVLINVWW